jgi:hypothetical protein
LLPVYVGGTLLLCEGANYGSEENSAVNGRGLCALHAYNQRDENISGTGTMGHDPQAIARKTLRPKSYNQSRQQSRTLVAPGTSHGFSPADGLSPHLKFQPSKVQAPRD